MRFYSEDTFCVLDPGFKNVYYNEAVPREILSEGDECFDYCLSKYQGRHSSAGETYSLIAQTIARSFAARETSAAQLKKATEQGNDRAKRSLARAVAANKTPAVVTVRNRLFKADLPLTQVMGLVKEVSPDLTVFDCSCCR